MKRVEAKKIDLKINFRGKHLVLNEENAMAANDATNSLRTNSDYIYSDILNKV